MSRTREVQVLGRAAGAPALDRVAVEEPLEIRVEGQALAVLLRTPGDDRELVAGFLFGEGLIDGADDLAALAPCRDPSSAEAAGAESNRWNVRLQPGCSGLGQRLEAARRRFTAGASCGLCGKASIESLAQVVRPHPSHAVVEAS
ncbi:MAG: formate dehydrogenase accessory sulfurtransferase FdhD, partial [Myxococcales bacterium]|nr:formate dehydrogenase accessory sulfurtransferase FdhD [Myxococcales bacterium]